MPTRVTPVPPCTFYLNPSSACRDRGVPPAKESPRKKGKEGEKKSAHTNSAQAGPSWLTYFSHNRGMAPVAHVLFNKFMKFNPKSTKWLNRDRFVLS